jgi:hypothetical protein
LSFSWLAFLSSISILLKSKAYAETGGGKDKVLKRLFNKRFKRDDWEREWGVEWDNAISG